MATPQVLSRKSNGVPPAAPGQASTDAPKPTKMKAQSEGEKVVIRRLPPGMTEEEFSSILGEVWGKGNGKVDWAEYCPGKISHDPAKPSRASRAYLHVMKRDELMALQEAVRTAVWEDSKETWTSPALIGPPVLEISVFKKIASAKKRSDARQGTIDQDPEFMAFLESLANPEASKEHDGEQGADESLKGEKVTTTPLIEYLKEKKANRAKEAAAAKSAKHSRQESQGGKGKASASRGEESKKKSRGERSGDKHKETVKILTKKSATEAAADAAKAVASQLQSGSSSGEAPKSRRAGIAAAARILQRDLGLSLGNAHRKARQEVAKVEAESKTAVPGKEGSSSTAPEPTASSEPTAESAASKSQTTAATSSGKSRSRKRRTVEDSAKGSTDKATESVPSAPAKPPVILMKKKGEPAAAAEPAAPSALPGSPAHPPTPTAAPAPTAAHSATTKATSGKPTAASKKSGAAATPSPGATRAFIKHVNPAQGVNESTLKETLEAFGPVSSVELDRRKGFAYAQFKDHEGLAKAMAASPIAIGQTTVQVLERKEMGGKKDKAPAAVAGAAAPAPAPNASAKGSTDAGSKASLAPTGPAADAKSAGAQEKRGGRRRGGRGRGGGDKDPGTKEDVAGSTDGGKSTEGETARASTPAALNAG